MVVCMKLIPVSLVVVGKESLVGVTLVDASTVLVGYIYIYIYIYINI